MASAFPMFKFRPCLVKGEKGLFHCWYNVSEIVAPSLMAGGHSGGVLTGVMALVEYEDGFVRKTYPGDIQFLDNPFADYDFSIKEEKSHV